MSIDDHVNKELVFKALSKDCPLNTNQEGICDIARVEEYPPNQCRYWNCPVYSMVNNLMGLMFTKDQMDHLILRLSKDSRSARL